MKEFPQSKNITKQATDGIPQPDYSKIKLYAVIIITLTLATVLTIGGLLWYQNRSKEEEAGSSSSQSSELSTDITENSSSDQRSSQENVENFITANPLDLTQIASLSKFRSCSGHDFSGENADGVVETNRSMKHYIEPILALAGSEYQIKSFAPFDGFIEQIQPEENPRGVQVWVKPYANNEGWHFIFFHIDLVAGLEMGSEVEAGQLIGYGDIVGGGNFDMALGKFINETGMSFDELLEQFQAGEIKELPEGITQVFDSPFYYMTDEVLAEYAAVGVTPENIVLTKEFRDNNPCVFDLSEDYQTDWVTLL